MTSQRIGKLSFIWIAFAIGSLTSCVDLEQALKSSTSASFTGTSAVGGGSTSAGVPNAAFQTCYTNNPTTDGGIGLATCLNQSAVAGATFTAGTIASCVANGNSSAAFLAICLSQNGQVVLQNHSAKQYEIDACNTAVGEADIAKCLDKHGADLGVTQGEINQCNSDAGEFNIEKCLHLNKYISTQPIVMQTDADLCNLIEGGTGTLALCLQNSLLLPSTVSQSDVAVCLTAATETGVIRCLRAKYYVSNTLMQYHINVCNNSVGQTGIANCLYNNGVLPTEPVPSPAPTLVPTETPTQIEASLQLDINACITAVGEANVAQCLRKRGIIADQVMQQHIDSCFLVSGVNAYVCLAANFATLPANLTTTNLQACFTKNGGGSTGAAICLATQGVLPTAPQQTHIRECARYAGIDVDGTGTLPGQVGISTCLANSGMTASQVDINTCVSAVGVPNVAACLAVKGFVPAYSQMISPSGIFGTYCTTCHNAGNLNGNMNVSSYISVAAKLTAGDAADSTIYMEVSSGAMPKNGPNLATTQPTLVTLLQTWINQGANDDVDVPAVATTLITGGTPLGNLSAGGGIAAAFNGNTSQAAAASAEAVAVGGYIGESFLAGETVTKYSLWGSSDLCYNNPAVNGATTLLLQYSDDNITYTTVDAVTTTTSCTGPDPITRYVPGANMSHLYWRIAQAPGSAGDLIIGQLEFFGY